MDVLNADRATRDAHGPGTLRRLACAIIGHDPTPGAVANRGYDFARCTRCGASIMRAVFGGWRTPPAGYRIVWPGERTTPARVHDGDFMRDGAPPPQPHRGSRVIAGDFMAEDADIPPARPLRRHQAG